VRALLDTSVLIGDIPPPEEVEAAISVASITITELHFGALVADDDHERARRTARLAVVEATFDPLPVSVAVARVWGQLAAAVTRHGGNPRRRQIDLAIAATAHVEGVPLITEDIGDFQVIDEMVDVRRLSEL
jgi:predicted nucleic acid-binding protein